ncbi:MAG: hypothetical protein ACTHOR_14990 [Devosia sp.]
MLKKLVAAALVLGLLPLAGCSTTDLVGGELIRNNGPTGVITIINGTGYNFDIVEISACEVNTYGLNRLPSGTSIPPGGSYDFEVSAGCWDVGAGAWGVGDATHRLDVAPYGRIAYTITD